MMKQFPISLLIFMLLALSLVLAACQPTTIPPATPTGPGEVSPTPPTGEAYPPPLAETPGSEAPTPDPTTAYPPPDSTTRWALTRFDMLAEQNGWGTSREAVLRTRDGGRTWVEVTPDGLPGDQVSSLEAHFLDLSTAWVMIPDSQNPDLGRLYRTVDAGETWEGIDAPFGYAELDFLDAENGAALVGRGAGAGSMAVDLYRTTDGGRTWEAVFQMEPGSESQPGELPFSGIKSGVAFRNLTDGWVTGSIPMDGFVYLYVTRDGGSTWEQQEVSLPSGYGNAQVSTEPPVFFSEQEGVLPVTLYSGSGARVFYVTSDGGQTWTPTTPVPSLGAFSIASLNDFFAWDGGVFYSSHDGGVAWNTFNPNLSLNQVLAGLDFVNATAGWASSQDLEGNVEFFKTEDGGLTWAEVWE